MFLKASADSVSLTVAPGRPLKPERPLAPGSPLGPCTPVGRAIRVSVEDHSYGNRDVSIGP